MNVKRLFANPVALLAFGCLAFSGLCGCQTNTSGQTLPSAYYLRDDIQFFPAGPEDQLPRTKRAMQEYRAAQAGFAADLTPAP